ALDLGYRHALDPNFAERVFDLVQLERLDDRFDLFHLTLPARAAPHSLQGETSGALLPWIRPVELCGSAWDRPTLRLGELEELRRASGVPVRRFRECFVPNSPR